MHRAERAGRPPTVEPDPGNAGAGRRPPMRIVIIGAGIIGVATAWRCAQRGLDVTLVDPDPDRGAWHAAAGMLAPLTEAEYTETPLLRLNLDSLARYPAFVAEVADETGLPTGYRDDGTRRDGVGRRGSRVVARHPRVPVDARAGVRAADRTRGAGARAGTRRRHPGRAAGRRRPPGRPARAAPGAACRRPRPRGRGRRGRGDAAGRRPTGPPA